MRFKCWDIFYILCFLFKFSVWFVEKNPSDGLSQRSLPMFFFQLNANFLTKQLFMTFWWFLSFFFDGTIFFFIQLFYLFFFWRNRSLQISCKMVVVVTSRCRVCSVQTRFQFQEKTESNFPTSCTSGAKARNRTDVLSKNINGGSSSRDHLRPRRWFWTKNQFELFFP